MKQIRRYARESQHRDTEAGKRKAEQLDEERAKIQLPTEYRVCKSVVNNMSSLCQKLGTSRVAEIVTYAYLDKGSYQERASEQNKRAYQGVDLFVRFSLKQYAPLKPAALLPGTHKALHRAWRAGHDGGLILAVRRALQVSGPELHCQTWYPRQCWSRGQVRIYQFPGLRSVKSRPGRAY